MKLDNPGNPLPQWVDKPSNYPHKQVGGSPLKPITQVLLERRATSHFKPDLVPDEYLEAILRFAGQAPSGYNIQPWHFLVVRDAANRKRLQKAAKNQEKVGEAPVVVIAFGIPGEWKETLATSFDEGIRRGVVKPDQAAKAREAASAFVDKFPPSVWLSRHVMIAFTTMMLTAEAFGLDTAPMEGFDPEAVRKEFKLPENAEVIALLAIGFAQLPDKPYGGRRSLEEFVHVEEFGQPWKAEPTP